MRPAGRGSIVDPSPHQLAQRLLSVKNRKTTSGTARIRTVLSNECSRVFIFFLSLFVSADELSSVVARDESAPTQPPASGARAHRPTSVPTPSRLDLIDLDMHGRFANCLAYG